MHSWLTIHLLLLSLASHTEVTSGTHTHDVLQEIKDNTRSYLPWEVQRLFLRNLVQDRKIINSETHISRDTIGIIDLYIDRTTGLILATEVIEAPSIDIGEIMRLEVSGWEFIPTEVTDNEIVKVTIAFYFSPIGDEFIEMIIPMSDAPEQKEVNGNVS